VEFVAKHDIDTSKTDSILFVDQDKMYAKSTAALKIARHLSCGYPLLYGFIIVPNFIRNWVYDIIAKNRYKWFGRKDSCMIPTPELKDKFL
jgi:predicted DCC family thiol-disulfide oxidoreductase YuxK